MTPTPEERSRTTPDVRIGSQKIDAGNGRARHEFRGDIRDTFGIVFSTGLILNLTDSERNWHIILSSEATEKLAARFAERAQAPALLARVEELQKALASIVRHMDSNGMGAWPVAKSDNPHRCAPTPRETALKADVLHDLETMDEHWPQAANRLRKYIAALSGADEPTTAKAEARPTFSKTGWKS